VSDISQTEGQELPEVEVPALTGEANEELLNGALSLAKLQGLEVTFESRPHQDPAIKGMYSGKTIWVRPEESCIRARLSGYGRRNPGHSS